MSSTKQAISLVLNHSKSKTAQLRSPPLGNMHIKKLSNLEGLMPQRNLFASEEMTSIQKLRSLDQLSKNLPFLWIRSPDV
jgi:hypothetical protein